MTSILSLTFLYRCHALAAIPSLKRSLICSNLLSPPQQQLPFLQSRYRRQHQQYLVCPFSSDKHSHGSGTKNTNNSGRNNHHQKDSHRRLFSHFKVNVRAESPFEILGVDQTATYQEVKRRFVELALQHHPDTTNTVKNNNDNINDDCSYQDDKHKSMEQFIRFRKAFEALKEDVNGIVSTRRHDDDSDESLLWSSDEEFNAWFYEETGHADIMFRMDMQTRKEVINVVQSQAQGGLDRGGMWEMARKMAEQEEMLKGQKHKYPKTFVRLETGTSVSPSSSVRRKRKRGG
jgi:hypothetical protein